MAHREANPGACGGTTSSHDAPRWACCLVAVRNAATLAACGNATDNGPAAAYRQAVAKTRAAHFLVLSQGDAVRDRSGGELFVSPHLLVIKSRGRIVAWTARTYEWTWRPSSHCYERHTDFNRDDVRQERAFDRAGRQSRRQQRHAGNGVRADGRRFRPGADVARALRPLRRAAGGAMEDGRLPLSNRRPVRAARGASAPPALSWVTATSGGVPRGLFALTGPVQDACSRNQCTGSRS